MSYCIRCGNSFNSTTGEVVDDGDSFDYDRHDNDVFMIDLSEIPVKDGVCGGCRRSLDEEIDDFEDEEEFFMGDLDDFVVDD